jgi:hypothetical protein
MLFFIHGSATEVEEMSDEHPDPRPLMTFNQTAKRLGVSNFMARKAAKDGVLDVIILGPRTQRVLPESVDRLLLRARQRSGVNGS